MLNNEPGRLDYRVRSSMAGVAPLLASESIETFTKQELNAMIDTAHDLKVKVAAHCTGLRCLDLLKGTGGLGCVDSVEHAYSLSNAMVASKEVETRVQEGHGRKLERVSTWVPTLAAYYTMGVDTDAWAQAARSFQEVLKREDIPFNIACGGDTGVFAHGDNALEMKLMVRLGADWRKVLSWGTRGGWECIRSLRWEEDEGKERLAKVEEMGEDARIVGDNEVPFGAIRKGFAADLIATTGDLEGDFEDAVDKGSICFVMKAGRLYKLNGAELGR